MGIKLKGYSFADGVHWHTEDGKEIAIIDEARREIMWLERPCNLSEELVEAVRNKMPNNPGQWLIEARRTRSSVTQGNVSIFVNGKDMDMHFEDKIELNTETGEWESTTSDEELGKFVFACFWHKLDHVHHYSDRFKELFKPNWRKEE